MDGYVSARTSYSDWLKEQPEIVQREVLVAAGYSLFKIGDKISSFVYNWKTLALEQLIERGVLEVSV